jgi:pre-mRNA-splicing factor SPF27
VQEVNWSRKSLQCKAGDELRHLESTWVLLVSRNYDIEQACVNLQQQIQRYSELLEAKRDNHDYNSSSDQDM